MPRLHMWAHFDMWALLAAAAGTPAPPCAVALPASGDFRTRLTRSSAALHSRAISVPLTESKPPGRLAGMGRLTYFSSARGDAGAPSAARGDDRLPPRGGRGGRRQCLPRAR